MINQEKNKISNEAPSTDVKSNENPNDGTSKDGKSNGRITYSR